MNCPMRMLVFSMLEIVRCILAEEEEEEKEKEKES